MKKHYALLLLVLGLILNTSGVATAKAYSELEIKTRMAGDPFHYWLSQLEQWTVVVYDMQSQSFQGQHPEHWDHASIPASTYKVPHSLIGLQSGVITPQSTFAWDGKLRSIPAWNRDHDLASALQVSCVPCFQQLARNIGVLRMREHLAQLQFGNMDVQTQNLDHFWLRGNSQISPRQQTLFLARLAQKKLPLDTQVQEQVLKIMQDPEIPGLYAKTGWGIVPDQQGSRRHVGWYVGVYQTQNQHYSFAVQIIATDPTPPDFAQMRKQLLFKYFKALGIMP